MERFLFGRFPKIEPISKGGECLGRPEQAWHPANEYMRHPDKYGHEGFEGVFDTESGQFMWAGTPYNARRFNKDPSTTKTYQWCLPIGPFEEMS